MERDNAFNLAMLMLRIIVGSIFVVHGAQKMFGMFGGIGIEGMTKMVEGLGFSNPHILALVWAGIEFIGGIFLVLGISARGAAVGIVLVTFIRIWKVNIVYGSFVQSAEIEYNLLVLSSCIPLILVGGGSWSVWDV